MMFSPILRRVIPAVMALYGYRQLRLLRSENTRLRHDPVTGLPTRAAWTADAVRALPRMREPVVVLCDMIHFKRINDAVDHRTGDLALASFAAGLVAEFGPDALVGRFGGDEFVVLLDTPPEYFDDIGERLARCTVNVSGVRSGPAAGIAQLRQIERQPATAAHGVAAAHQRLRRTLHAADLACRRAKERCHATGAVTGHWIYGAGDPPVPAVLPAAPVVRTRHRRDTGSSL